jgi:hypothetical protein
MQYRQHDGTVPYDVQESHLLLNPCALAANCLAHTPQPFHIRSIMRICAMVAPWGTSNPKQLFRAMPDTNYNVFLAWRLPYTTVGTQ